MKIETFTCSCSTTFCNCRKNFTSQSTSSTIPVKTTTEMYINGEKVTKNNSIEVIFNKIKYRQKKERIKEAMKEKKILRGINEKWILN